MSKKEGSPREDAVGPVRKRKCPIKRSDFEAVNPFELQVPTPGRDGFVSVVAMPREYSTGSLGWHHSGKIVVLVNGIPTTCQMSVQITVVGSKELPR